MRSTLTRLSTVVPSWNAIGPARQQLRQQLANFVTNAGSAFPWRGYTLDFPESVSALISNIGDGQTPVALVDGVQPALPQPILTSAVITAYTLTVWLVVDGAPLTP